MQLKVAANSSLMDKEDIVAYVEMCANEANATIKDKVAILDSMFHDGASVPVIDEDSEED